MPADSQLEATIAAIDQVHQLDPQAEVCDGQTWPAELLRATRMTNCLLWLEPQASVPLQLAVRGQHLRRWQLPRADYPMDRVGYLKWRTELKNLHAMELGQIMTQHGYADEDVKRAQSLVKKERFKTDPEAQLLEDTVCLVFLQYELAGFMQQHPRDKVIDILRKTWPKMSARAQGIALELPLTESLAALVGEALSTKE
jgi:hypothetical protein